MSLRPLSLLCLLLTTFLIANPASAQLTSKEKACAIVLAKAGSKLSGALTKLQQSCVKAGTKGKLSSTVDTCVADDTKGKVSGARSNTQALESKKCTEGSGFLVQSAALTNDAADNHGAALAALLFGDPLDPAISIEKATGSCQTATQKSADKRFAAGLGSYLKCRKSALATATTLTPLEDCLGSSELDSKVTKAIEKVDATVTKKCATENLATTFPGACSSADQATLTDCVETASRCQLCQLIVEMDGLGDDCTALGCAPFSVRRT